MGHYTINAKDYEFKPHDFLLLSEGQILTGYHVSDDFSGLSFIVSPELTEEIIKGVQNLSQLFMFFRSRPVYRLGEEEADTFIFYFNLIKQKIDGQQRVFRKEIVTALLKATLYELGENIWEEGEIKTVQYRAERVFNNFIKLVEANFHRERRVGWYAEQLCISAKYLSESVKQVSQRTPNEWIDHYVIVEMKVQLKNTMKSVKEIAQAMNFPNQSFMGKYFKQHTGLSPLKYRKS
jgi:AraC-like DNA-binding protein